MSTSKSSLTTRTLLSLGCLALVGCAGGETVRLGGGKSLCCQSIAPVKTYPLERCLVTDNPFDHGKPYSFIHHGQAIKLCRRNCLAEFKIDPASYLTKLKAAK